MQTQSREMRFQGSYVEVDSEPLHRERYKNDALRAYIATMKPGESTLYHRHSYDTIYIALNGGWIRTIPYRKGQRTPVIFPRSVNLLDKLRLGIQQIVTGSIHLPDSLTFVMLNTQRNCIHKATASRRNDGDMRLMGIEVFHRVRRQHAVVFDTRVYTHEYAGEYFSMGSVTLKPGEQSGMHTHASPFFLLCVHGTAEIVSEHQEHSKSCHAQLAAGDFLSLDECHNMNILNTGTEHLGMLLIALPSH